MTGIAAIFATGPSRQAQLGVMMSAMADRVHDASGVWNKQPFALGALVLHTTAESFEAPQPLTNEDESLAIVLDGYLTNWEDLRSELLGRGAILRTRSDAELVLRAYEQWGEDCADRVEGEFAFVIADTRAHRVYAARDHKGLRPLHWYRDGDALIFASDIRAIIAACAKRPSPNLDYLANIAAGEWHLRDATVWQGVERVPQAHWLSFDGHARKSACYFSLPTEVTVRYRREADYVEHYREVLFEAVRRTSRSHRPLAVSLSGGLDSSAVLGIARRLEHEGRLPAPGIEGYTLAGEPGTPAYELPYARAVAEHCGVPLFEVPLFRPDIAWFNEQGRKDRDVPIPQNGAMSLDLERLAHANGCRAYVTGAGGDEWLDGTPLYYRQFARDLDVRGYAAALARDTRALGWRRAAARAARPTLGALLSAPARARRYERVARGRLDNPEFLFWMLPFWRERLIEQELAFERSLPLEPDDMFRRRRLFSPYPDFANTIFAAQVAKSGLETRNPMLTRDFITFSATTPEWIRNQGGLTKVVHRKAVENILPAMVVERRDKAHFNAPSVAAEFARYIEDQGDRWLHPFCHADGIRQLTQPKNELPVDPNLCWEIWGLYAVAAFFAQEFC